MDPRTTTAVGRLLRLVAFVGLIGGSVAAQQPGPLQEAIRGRRMSEAPRIEGRRVVATRIEDSVGAFTPLRNTSTRPAIYGSVLNYLGDLVPNAGEVLIRSLADGTVVANVSVDQFAQFIVPSFEPGLYTAQVVGQTGKTVATTGAFTAAAGDVIRLAPIVPNSALANVAEIFGNSNGNSTSRVVDSAASSGVLAVRGGAPVSPETREQ